MRSWNAETGELTGWMPMHQVAITLEQLGPPTGQFQPDEAVTVVWPKQTRRRETVPEVRISPETRVIDGRKWVPADRDLNIVWIRKLAFYIKSIVFSGGDAHGPRHPAPHSSAAQ